MLALAASYRLRPDHAGDEAAVRALAAAIGRERIDLALAFHAALETPAWRDLGARFEAAGVRHCPLLARELALDGRQVMAHLGLPPSRMVGRLLEALLLRVWQNPTLNTPEALALLLPSIHAEAVAASPDGAERSS